MVGSPEKMLVLKSDVRALTGLSAKVSFRCQALTLL